ncbi:MAG: ABC transporter ATP-binding protein/permease [Clostridiaceae bacterium]|nr:ABC transporter ATP-binding protein/permease [Clostridiaceae bacterium]
MLQLVNISKIYRTGDLVQTALNGVSLTLRANEFVAVLGPSGSGKTTLLNVIGGLDRYDSGDLLINGVSTKRYRDRDWDTYRNHSIGFVFQNYNLIQHQSILANVELALTLSGVSRAERRRRALEALEAVDLRDQAHKRPNQMSGGQMQRVAIARALVNNPDILLADEPTGALDYETGVQVLDLLKEVAKERLVVMVTHNREWADRYATRTISLRDGEVIGDTDPYEPVVAEATSAADEVAKKARRSGKSAHRALRADGRFKRKAQTSMSFWTALTLSFNNLRTKKGRTFLTSFAGSIGIIGIALILSLSNGVNSYIVDVQKETMSSYPITISAETFDMSEIMDLQRRRFDRAEVGHELDGVYTNDRRLLITSQLSSSIRTNNLTAFKKYLDDPSREIHKHIGQNGIVYSYKPKFTVFSYDPDGTVVNADGRDFRTTGSFGEEHDFNDTEMPGMDAVPGFSRGNFSELLPGVGEELIGSAVSDNYSLLAGEWPTKYDEAVLVLDETNEISTNRLYELGLLPTAEYRDLLARVDSGEKLELEQRKLDYAAVLEQVFYVVPAGAEYERKTDGTFSHIGYETESVERMMAEALQLKISGVIRANSRDTNIITSVVGYTKALTDYLINYNNNSPVALAQAADPGRNVLTGLSFAPETNAMKLEDLTVFIKSLGMSDKAKMARKVLSSARPKDPAYARELAQRTEAELIAMFDQIMRQLDEKARLGMYEAYVSPGTLKDNLSTFGVISRDAPTAISIYVDSFEDKDGVAAAIEAYNKDESEENRVTYTDYVGLLMSTVTTIVNVITYVLIAFVAVSLVVSSIMIGVITYISVLERTKEIGILRAIGASKGNISQVFNAETFIIGLMSGLIGIGVTLLLLTPINMLIHSLAGTTSVNAILPPLGAIILILLSLVLTVISGLIPARKAARKDPVAALRAE